MTIYREIAISGMVGTIEDAMRQVLDCWAELPPEMQEAIDRFRVQLGAAIDSVYIVKRPSTRKWTKARCVRVKHQ